MIQDDLIHMHTIYGLAGLGFSSDSRMLDISSSVFDLMGINMNDRRFENLTDEYMERTSKIVHIKSIDDHAQLEALSLDVYNYIAAVHKMHK